MAFQTPITIKSVLHKIDYNQLLLPAIQREFEWEWWKIELLFDSLMRDYPIGSMLFWRVEGENRSKQRFYTILKEYREHYKTHCDEIDTSGLSSFEAVLDGQQRLTAIYLGLKGSYAYKIKYRHLKDDEHSIPTRKLYLNLDNPCPQNELEGDVPEDGRFYDFRFFSDWEINNLNGENWFPVREILKIEDNFDLNEYLKKNGWDEDKFKSKTLSKLQFVVHTKLLINYYLETGQDYEKALNIFIRINSGGKPLSYSDLIMSTIVAVWTKVNARDVIHRLVDFIWDEYGFIIDKDIILRSYLMLYCDDIKFRVTNFNVENAIEFEDNWNSISDSIKEAFRLVMDFAYAQKTLSSVNAILPIIYYIHNTKKYKDFSTKIAYKEDREVIKKWLHTVLLHRIFGGQADSVLKNIRDAIKKGIEEGAINFPAKEIAKRLAKTRKSITVDDEFLENLLHTQKDDRYAFPILALLYPNMDYRNNDFNLDHIHPFDAFKRKNLQKANILINEDNEWYFENSSCYNGIVNLQMLDSNANKSKGSLSLIKWVEKEKPILNKTFITNKNHLLENFPEFVDERWEVLKIELKKAMSFQ
ncbi:DUF262 domain-containing protein [Rasiella sp. SM2506]|uniref:DUF262 domain-containing protein n=1 Tax=Rasiella sp. SM2506 TaxID=3423914 RepID=UPI003D79B100